MCVLTNMRVRVHTGMCISEVSLMCTARKIPDGKCPIHRTKKRRRKNKTRQEKKTGTQSTSATYHALVVVLRLTCF